MSIFEKLTALQQDLNVPKNQFNSFGKYSYRSCEDILEAVKPLLAKHGLTLYISDEIRPYGERYYLCATATLADGEEKMHVTGWARETEVKKGLDESQITGAASSYARKYALAGLLLLDDNKDADTLNKHGKEDKGEGSNTDDNPLGVTCAYCGKPLTDEVYKGKKLTVAQIVANCKKNYGGTMLHANCAAKWKEEHNA
jgi:hypothetical protein